MNIDEHSAPKIKSENEPDRVDWQAGYAAQLFDLMNQGIDAAEADQIIMEGLVEQYGEEALGFFGTTIEPNLQDDQQG